MGKSWIKGGRWKEEGCVLRDWVKDAESRVLVTTVLLQSLEWDQTWEGWYGMVKGGGNGVRWKDAREGGFGLKREAPVSGWISVKEST